MRPADETHRELEVIGSDADCSYLPGRQSRMHYRLALSLTAARYEQLLARGWRRFGRTLFRPVCSGCRECQGLRIDIPAFQPARSQRKARRKNDDLQVVVQRPTLTSEHLELYNAYHRDMHERRNWPFQEIDADHYAESFLDGHFPFSREFQYRRDGRLVALGIVDMTGSAMSSIYFVYDPTLRDRSLGTMSVVREVEEGQRTGHRWLYLGYYIRDCPSMNYKNRYQPHEILNHFVADDETPRWTRQQSADDSTKL